MLTSYLPGRLRLRPKEIPDNLTEIFEISARPGVKSLTPNYRSRSLLLEYYPDQLPLATIAAAVGRFDSEAAKDLWRIAAGGQRYPASPFQPDLGAQDLISLSVSLISKFVPGFSGLRGGHLHF